MNPIEKNAVKIVAKIAPWLAPFPSAFFVARSAVAHLDVPLLMAVVIAGIVETLGLASVHTWLWLSDWNSTKRKNDPAAPVNVAVSLGITYLVATVSLTVVLEVAPGLATYAPILFPVLAVVGAVNLALISQQEQKEVTVNLECQERKAKRQAGRSQKRQPAVQGDGEKVSALDDSGRSLEAANKARAKTKAVILDTLISWLTILNDQHKHLDSRNRVHINRRAALVIQKSGIPVTPYRPRGIAIPIKLVLCVIAVSGIYFYLRTGLQRKLGKDKSMIRWSFIREPPIGHILGAASQISNPHIFISCR